MTAACLPTRCPRRRGRVRGVWRTCQTPSTWSARGRSYLPQVSTTLYIHYRKAWQCTNIPVARGRHYKRYSAIAITLRYVFALLHNALYLWRIVITSDSYRFRLRGHYRLWYLSLWACRSLHFVIVLSNIRKRYCFWGSNGVNSVITLPSSRIKFLLQNIQNSLVIFALLYNALP